MQYLGLIFEILFFAAAAYGYLFTRGYFQAKDPEVQAKAERFRKENGWWLRLGCLLIMALMGIEIFLNVQSLV